MGWAFAAWGTAAAALASAAALSARAADQPSYGPPPAWVKDVPLPTDAKPTGAAVDVLLVNNQQRLTPGDDETFNEVVARVNSAQGLAGLGNLIETWDPSTQTLAIHRARILRGAQTIDLLSGGKKFTVIRRETGLEAATIDGRLTATLQPEDVRVGDILDLAVSFTHREPALKDHSEDAVFTAHHGVIHKVYVRTSWLKSRAPKTFKTDDLPPFSRTDAGDRVEIGFTQTDAVSPEPPKGAPPFESGFGLVLMSDFADWADVSRTIFPLFDKAATLAPTSPLRAEIDKIAKAHPDQKGRALAALELAEGDVRYLALLINAGGLTPAPADLTWSRRYGDCKGKTVLLLALLRGLGVQAEPALVSTTSGDGLDRIPPLAAAFDHVMVRATIGGEVYWLDATRLGDESLDALDVPNLHFALPLTREGLGLTPLTPKKPALPYIESKMSVDLTAGLDKPAKVHRETILRGDLGRVVRQGLNAASPTDRDRGLRDLLRGGRDWINPDKMDWTYDPATMTFTGKLDGTGAPPFTSPTSAPSAFKEWNPVDDPVERSTDLRRTTDYHRDAPYAVPYPSFTKDQIEIRLPGAGRGFSVRNGEPVDQDAAGLHYTRTVSLDGGRFDAVVSRRALQPRFDGSQGERAETALKTLNSYDVTLRYTPAGAGRVVAEKGAKPQDDARKRGQAALAANDFTSAEAAFTEALTAAPDAKGYYDRAGARARMGKALEAKADLEAAVKLDPKPAFALLALGNIALDLGDGADAQQRFEAAVAAASADNRPALEVQISAAYERAKRLSDAVAWSDRYVADLPKNSPSRATALNGACWSRAMAGQDLQAALKMCDEAIGLRPDEPAMRDSRALVRLRLGDWAGAATDYDETLKHGTNYAFALYGRSIAERRLGQTAKADADVAAAKAARPDIEASFPALKPAG